MARDIPTHVSPTHSHYRFKEHELGVVSVATAVDGATVVSSCMDGNLRWYDLATGASIPPLSVVGTRLVFFFVCSCSYVGE